MTVANPGKSHESVSEEENAHWQRNLVVCALGAFSTIVGMTLIMPILPLYLGQLGVHGTANVTTWSGIAYAATFVTAGITAPLWGYLGDRYGRKLMLIRASLGMAIAMALIGVAQNVWQLVFFRLLTGLLGGYSSGATILVAAQTPKNRTAWALGVVSSAVMAGNIVGPLFGGVFGNYVGFRSAFFVTSGLIFLAFLGTLLFLHEPKSSGTSSKPQRETLGWSAVPNKRVVVMLLSLSVFLMFALVSVEPIISVHVQHLLGTHQHVALYGSIVFSVTALGTVLSAPKLGAIADRVGHLRVLIGSLACVAILFVVQGLVQNLWLFIGVRFLAGMALGAITPSVIAMIRSLIPHSVVGVVLGYNVSAQYVGQVCGPIVAGWVAGLWGTSSVFFVTAAVTVLCLAGAKLIGKHLPE